MRWLDEFQSKYGFNDGESIPNGAEAVREMFIKAINHFATKYGSDYRAFPFERAGSHNYYVLGFAPASDLKELDLSAEVTLEDTDDAFQRAIARIDEIELDRYVWIEAHIDESYQDILEEDDDES
jgi:hypothetical protein